jgi:acetolactate synthase I/II/III large subunit
MKVRGAHLIAEALRAEGVTHVFGVTGDANMELGDAIYDIPDMKTILTRHEQGAAFMADGFARASGKVGVASATKGPGAANAFAGIQNAYYDSIPVLLLAGQLFRSVEARNALQELPLTEVYSQVSKWAISLPSVERIPDIMRRAFTTMRSGRPGPVVVGMPMDISAAWIDSAESPYIPAGEPLRSTADPAELDRAVEMLLEAKNPFIVAGQAVMLSGASDELASLAEMLTAPVTSTLTGKSAFPESHPLSVGLGGYPKSVYATKQAVHFADKADVVLAVGCRFNEFSTCQWLPIPENVKLIHINADPTEINRIYRPQAALFGDAKLVLRDLLNRLNVAQGGKRLPQKTQVLAKLEEVRKQWWEEWMPKLTSDEVPINPFRLTWEFMKVVNPDDTIVLHDAGGVRGYVSHHYQAGGPRSYLGFGGASNMGWSVPAAVGAKLARPEKTVVCFVGDGAFGMNGMEVETSVRNNAPVLFIVADNSELTDITTAQDKHFEGRNCWCELSGDYAKIGEGLGAYAEKVTRPEEIRPAVERALSCGRSALIHVVMKAREPRPYTQLHPFGPTRMPKP